MNPQEDLLITVVTGDCVASNVLKNVEVNIKNVDYILRKHIKTVIYYQKSILVEWLNGLGIMSCL